MKNLLNSNNFTVQSFENDFESDLSSGLSVASKYSKSWIEEFFSVSTNCIGLQNACEFGLV